MGHVLKDSESIGRHRRLENSLRNENIKGAEARENMATGGISLEWSGWNTKKRGPALQGSPGSRMLINS